MRDVGSFLLLYLLIVGLGKAQSRERVAGHRAQREFLRRPEQSLLIETFRQFMSRPFFLFFCRLS